MDHFPQHKQPETNGDRGDGSSVGLWTIPGAIAERHTLPHAAVGRRRRARSPLRFEIVGEEIVNLVHHKTQDSAYNQAAHDAAVTVGVVSVDRVVPRKRVLIES